ncbi:hypothetical protein [Blastococcus sp. SYSU DS0533]
MDQPVRRPGPILYFVLGTMWAVLAVGGWSTSDDVPVTVVFALLAVGNLGVGTWLLRKQRPTARTGAAGR